MVYSHDAVSMKIKKNLIQLSVLLCPTVKKMYYRRQYHAVQHVGELLHVRISCKLYYTVFDFFLHQRAGWRLTCQLF